MPVNKILKYVRPYPLANGWCHSSLGAPSALLVLLLGTPQLCPPLAAEGLAPAERRASPGRLPCRGSFDGQRVRHFRLLLLWTLSWDLREMGRDLAHPPISTLCLSGGWLLVASSLDIDPSLPIPSYFLSLVSSISSFPWFLSQPQAILRPASC